MGIYRRKDKKGSYYGPWIIQYPYTIDTKTGKVKYTTEKIGFSKKRAQLALGKKVLEWEKRKLLGLELKKDYRFSELVDWYLELPAVKKLNAYKDIVNRSRIIKDHFGCYLARDLKPSMIEDYQQKRLSSGGRNDKPLKPATVNREIALLKRIFNLALREDMVEKNPCWKVKMLREDNVRGRIINHQEFTRLLDVSAEHLKPILITAYFTGMRLGEILNLKWDKVNIKEGYIDLSSKDTKTKEPRQIYFNEAVREVFSAAKKLRSLTHNLVFTYQSQPIKGIKTAFKTACKKAGIRDFRFHDFRHTFNTNMRKAGVDRSVIMKLTGHKTTSMFDRYNKIDQEDAQEAVLKLNSFLKDCSVDSITSKLLQVSN